MNGFLNSMLSVVLSWIRALISNVWTLLSSEDGGALYRFLSNSWLTIVIIVCAVCVVVDLVVYFFRWRPDYVWATHFRRWRNRRARRRGKELPVEEPVYETQPEPLPYNEPSAAYAPLHAAAPDDFSPPPRASVTWQDMNEPVWDEAAYWEDEEEAKDTWEQSGQTQVYAAPAARNTLEYYRDVQAGFAPAVSPEELYASAPDPETAPVHPGLDAETFRQNLGLEEQPPAPVPVMRAPAFRPFTVTHETREEPQAPGAFQRFAQKAREFVALDDAEHRTIHDLQPTVDVSKAFHEPVYPHSFDHNEE